MKILCDIGHPAHVHLFRNILLELRKKGHEYLITARDKDVTLKLLEAYKMPYVSLGKHQKNIYGKLYGILKVDFKLMQITRKFEPDVFISHGSIYAANISALAGKHHISMEDTGNMEQIRLYKPFTAVIMTPSCLNKNLGKKQIKYSGYHELAYLHPRYFKPDKSILKKLDINENEKFVIFRFVSWAATHDYSQRGISIEVRRELLELSSKKYKIFVSCEGSCPKELEKYRLKIPPETIHDVLFHATLYIGEGAKMASECALLGTPAIYVNSRTVGYLDEEERHGLVFGFRDSNGVMDKAQELLNTVDIKGLMKKRRDQILSEKIDVAAFITWFIDNYPKSRDIMKENPSYQYRFI
jgi:hypothetical protein